MENNARVSNFPINHHWSSLDTTTTTPGIANKNSSTPGTGIQAKDMTLTGSRPTVKVLAPADSIKNALTTGNCTASTLTTFNDLLVENAPNLKPATAVRGGSRAVSRSGTAKTKKVVIGSSSGLNANERYILATEVVNISLKALAAAEAKSLSTSKAQESTTEAPRKALTTKASVQIRAESSTAIVAECCRVALAHLRSEEKAKGLPALQLDKAQNSFINKLINVKLFDLALKELRILKARLEEFMAKSREVSSWMPFDGAVQELPSGKPIGKGNGCISGLLRFDVFEPASSAAGLAVGCQLNVLRCIVGMGNGKLVEEICPLLYPVPQLIPFQHPCAESKSQISPFSNVLLALCPGISSASDSKQTISPETAFKIQTIALEFRMAVEGDKEEQRAWQSLERCIHAYMRRSKESARSKYALCLEASRRVGGVRQKGPESFPKELCQLLATLAQQAGNNADALGWLNTNVGAITDECERVAQMAKVVGMQLKTMDGSNVETLQRVTSQVAETSTALDAIRKGNKDSLSRLVQEVAILRRTISIFLSGLQNPDRQVVDVLSLFAFSAIRFFTRYLALLPDNTAKIRKYGLSAMDGAGVYVRKLDCGQWEMADSLLQDCLQFIRDLDNVDSKSDEEPMVPTPYERVADWYWKLGLMYRKEGSTAQSVLAFTRSTSILEQRSESELLRSDYCSRLERIGSCWYDVGDLRRAERAYEDAVNRMCNIGLLERIQSMAATESLNKIFTDSNISSFGRCLINLITVRVKNSNDPKLVIPFEVESELYTVDTRGAILEWQLRQLSTMGSQYRSAARRIAERLLELYDDERPLRRARVIARVLEICLDFDEFWDVEAAVSLGESVLGPMVLKHDSQLLRFTQDLCAQCSLFISILSFKKGNPRTERLEYALKTWNSVIKSGSWDVASKKLEDPTALSPRIRMLVDFLGMKGLGLHATLAIQLSINVESAPKSPDNNELLRLNNLLAKQLLRLGYTDKAGDVLMRSKCYIEMPSTYTEHVLQWHVNYTEYLSLMGNFHLAMEHYREGSKIALATNSPADLITASYKNNLERKVAQNQLIAEAAYALSVLSFENGNINDSLTHIRRCIRLLQRNWAGLEMINNKLLGEADNRFGNEGDEKSKGPVVLSTTYRAFNSPLLWKLVPWMHSAFTQASHICQHQGMIREAEFYIEQALAVVQATNASSYIANALAVSGDLRVRSGRIEEGEKFLRDAAVFKGEIEKCKESVILQCAAAHLQRTTGLFDNELESYESAERKLGRVLEAVADLGLEETESAADELTKGLEKLDIADSRPSSSRSTSSRPTTPAKRNTSRGRRTPTQGSKTPTRARSKGVTAKATKKEDTTKTSAERLSHHGTLSQLKRRILRLQAECHASNGNFSLVESLLDKIAAAELSLGHESLSHKFVLAKALFLKGIAMLADDPSMCILQDSTLSIPNALLSNVSPAKVPSKKGKKVMDPSARRDEYVNIFGEAQQIAVEMQEFALKAGCASLAQRLSALIGDLAILISAFGSAGSKVALQPLYASYSLEISKGISLLREKDAITAEQALFGIRESNQWPQPDIETASEVHLRSQYLPGSLEEFQEEYINFIPDNWAAVSLSLSENKEELFITRFEAHETPFLVRLPLTRHNDRDDYEEVFDYKDGIQELQEIIKLVEESTHNAKITQTGNKEEIKNWWNEREELDARMKELLNNIEHCWLGGFRGLIRQAAKSEHPLELFRMSFDKILSKYLPSRQINAGRRRGKTPQPARVEIDSRIYELFVRLGDPESEDIQEPLVDLVHYVIDILHFHGEENPFDEIELDEIVVETTEALRAYHERLAEEGDDCLDEKTHTILILDKALHMFPWESLSCLDGQAISRMPSLAALREVLKHRNMQRGPETGIHLNRKSGSYILNPGRDLVSTQKTFEQELRSLPSWTGIINRPPTEEEFKSQLESRDIFLYFGHGSGAHYIRSRTVKKLDTCAVSLLMGCSSGKLHGCGEYEVWGMPWNYLLGGCPTLVACLWDVTDKDLDRFAKSVLDDWGLLSGCDKKSGKKKAGKKLSIVEAVAKNRDKCKIRYLNGAAMVVYGVPAYL